METPTERSRFPREHHILPAPTNLGEMKSSTVKFCAMLLIMLSSVVVHTDCCSSRSMPKSRLRPVPHFRGVMNSSATFTVSRSDGTSSSNDWEPLDTFSTGMDSRLIDIRDAHDIGVFDQGISINGGKSNYQQQLPSLQNRGGLVLDSSNDRGKKPSNRGSKKDHLLKRMGKCTQLFEENYCLNGGKCYNFTIANYTMPTCECADGFMGERCESKYLDGTYLSIRKPKIHIETASVCYGAFLTMMIVLAVFYYLHWFDHCL